MKPLFSYIKQNIDTISRITIFIVYFWFGGLKVIGASPAAELVTELQQMTLPFIGSEVFLIGLGLFEVLIGILFLFKKITRQAFLVLLAHMFTTFGPFVFLPEIVWNGFPSLTIEGQYIFKNVFLIALAANIWERFESR